VERLSRQAADREELEELTWNTYELGKAVSATDHLRALCLLLSVGRQFARFFDTYDVRLTPSWPHGPCRSGASMLTPRARHCVIL